MRRDREEKVHYKMYKDGKKWVYAGIFVVALSGAGLSASVLAPMAPVQAETGTKTETEVNVNYSWASDQAKVKAALASGNFADATPDNQLSTVQLTMDQFNDIVNAGLKLTLDGSKWYISPGPNYKQVDLHSVMVGSGFPSDDVLNNPTDPANEKAILDYIGSTALFTMNGGNTGTTGNNMYNSIISASTYSFSAGSGEATSSAPTISGTGYANIISGSLTTNSGSFTSKFLLTNGGMIKGTDPIIQPGITNGLKDYDFTTDSMSTELVKLKHAVQAINAEYDADSSNQATTNQWNPNAIEMDFANAKQIDGKYVFTVNTDNYAGISNCGFTFLSPEKYNGGDIVSTRTLYQPDFKQKRQIIQDTGSRPAGIICRSLYAH